MISLRQKIKLTITYTRPVLIITGLGSLSAAMLLCMISKGNLTTAFNTAIVLKLVITAIATLLFNMLTSKDQDYFYINIGLHPSKLLRWAILADILVFLILSTLIILIRNVIS